MRGSVFYIVKADRPDPGWSEDVAIGPSLTETSDLKLTEAAVNGDASAFTELCRRYYRPMVAIAHAVLGDRHLAEDAAQEAFAKAACKLSGLRKRNRFPTWLAAVCRNVAIDMARARQKLHTSSDLSVEVVADEPRQDGLTDAVREAMNVLSSSAKELVFLRYYDGMTYGQISAVLGISQQAINGRLRRAKKKIGDYLRRSGYVEV